MMSKTNVLLSMKSYGIGEVITGGTIGEVIKSYHPNFKQGEFVMTRSGWQLYAVVNGNDLEKIDESINLPHSALLGILGMPGMTAYFGLLRVGALKERENVLVSSAAGAVGSTVCQIAKLKGCRVVGIAGSDDKCEYLRSSGCDEAINYKTCGNLKEAVKKACPNGVDVYFDNVGHEMLEAAIESLNKFGRIPLCGHISQYNKLDSGLDKGPNLISLVGKEGRIEGFTGWRWFKEWPQARKEMYQWILEGKVKYKENLVNGFENIPKAFMTLFEGGKIGKIVVKISPFEE